MKLGVVLFCVLLINFTTASCSGNQININSASLGKLDELYGIGPVKAQAIIDTRPFDAIDDLIDVSGIGEVTLQNIKGQGLACVEALEVEETVEIDEKIKEVEPDLEEDVVSYNEPNEPQVKQTEEVIPIRLNAQTIKSENADKDLDKGKYSLYGFIGFCLLLIVLFIIKARRDKNEFRD